MKANHCEVCILLIAVQCDSFSIVTSSPVKPIVNTSGCFSLSVFLLSTSIPVYL